MRWLRLPPAQRPNLVMMYSPRRRRSRPSLRGPTRPRHTPAFAPPTARSACCATRCRKLGRDRHRSHRRVGSRTRLRAARARHRRRQPAAESGRARRRRARDALDLAGSGRPEGESRLARGRAIETRFRTCVSFAPANFPAEWQTEQNRRFGDLFLLADPGYEFISTVPRVALHARRARLRARTRPR